MPSRPPARSRARSTRLRARFPEDLKARVVYDSTVFVNDTISEVLWTVGEAFILVVIVVFLFLGSLRATIIPAVAVPVSLIGTFAFLLMVGYSANTVSLLALVLAIGIVVDDAIVVVENVERVMQEHPELEPHEATLEAMRQITGPIIAISLVLLSVFVPVAFIPGISGQLFRQFAVTISIAMLISAINALTLSPALCAIFLRHEIPTRGPIYHVLHGINLVRDGYARIVQRLIRISLVSLPLVVLIGAGIFWPGAHHPDQLPAGRGSGRVLPQHPAARRRLGGADQRDGAPGRSHPEEDAAGAGRVRRDRLLAARRRQRSRTPPSPWPSSSRSRTARRRRIRRRP